LASGFDPTGGIRFSEKMPSGLTRGIMPKQTAARL
jgi:hypothetical protein